MPKNIKGGNKAKSQKNSSGGIQKKRDIPTPDKSDDSHVAVITKVFGDSRYSCQIVTSHGVQPKDIYTHLSRGVKKKYGHGIIIGIGTYILIAIREFEKEKTDILFIYKDSELSYLIDHHYILLTNNKDNIKDEIEFSNYIETSPLILKPDQKPEQEIGKKPEEKMTDDLFDFSGI